MAIELKMPALSPTMEQGTLAKWLKAEGDRIEPGDIIAEIETDKATMEFEAIDEGVLSKDPDCSPGTRMSAVGTGNRASGRGGRESAPSPARCAHPDRVLRRRVTVRLLPPAPRPKEGRSRAPVRADRFGLLRRHQAHQLHQHRRWREGAGASDAMARGNGAGQTRPS